MKKTLCFTQPAYLSTRLKQLVVELVSANEEKNRVVQVPLDDIAVLVLEHPQITITHTALSALVALNAAVITCAENYLPNGLFLNLQGNTLQSKRFRSQLEASLPLKKQLWAQTVQQKIKNQALVLGRVGVDPSPLLHWSSAVKSGDADNREARAAAWYWPRLFKDMGGAGDETGWDWDGFIRDRSGEWPNALLNYGYAVLRAVIARSLVAAGLLPTLGIHHRNQYNAYCLADDIMEPYRPSVDWLVYQLVQSHPLAQLPVDPLNALVPELKKILLTIPVLDVRQDGKVSPLMEAAKRTASSLSACFEGTDRKIIYPETIV
jgi:CRISPR-associated protein Cas1